MIRTINRIPPPIVVNSIKSRSLGQFSTVQSPATDLRSFLDALREDGDLVDVYHEVDPHLEIGAIARRVSERNARVPLFHNVKGKNQDLWRIVSNLQSLSQSSHHLGRIARGIGLPPTAGWKEISQKLLYAKKAKPQESQILQTGPCKQNKILGSDIDLTQLPAPLLHQSDGGKYLQSYGMNILKSPNGSWTNWSISRSMIHGKNKLVGLCVPPQHNWQIREMWRAQGKDVPWALALGVSPAAIIAAGLPIPDGVSELDYVNALTGHPLDLVRCETHDLLVPANSEIILEGTMSTSEYAPEGPFGEYFGHAFNKEAHRMPVYNVDAITYRDNPILPISVPGTITDESHTLAALMAPEILAICREHDLPILDAFAPLETNATFVFLKVDSERLRTMDTNPKALSRKIGDAIFNDKRGWLASRILLVGDDIDIYDFKQAIWAFACRSRPGQDEFIFDDVAGLPLVPYMANTPRPCRGGKVVSNCLLESEFTPEGRNYETVNFESSYPQDIKDRVLKKWKDMNLD